MISVVDSQFADFRIKERKNKVCVATTAFLFRYLELCLFRLWSEIGYRFFQLGLKKGIKLCYTGFK